MHFYHYTFRHDKEKTLANTLFQSALIILTLSATSLISLGYPEYGILVNMSAQFFWLYNTYKIWKDDDTQWGMFVLSIIMAIVIAYGVYHYWCIG